MNKKYKVWECKIVVPFDSKLPDAFDAPPRVAAISAVEKAGIHVLNCFSGWGGKLSKFEKIVNEEEGYKSKATAETGNETKETP